MGHCDILGKQVIFVYNDIILNMSQPSKFVLFTAVTSHVGLLMHRMGGKEIGADNIFSQIKNKIFLKLLLEALK